MEIITSLENKKIKYINKLKNKKFRDEEGIFVIETKHLVEEAYKSGFLTELYLVDTNIESNILEDDKINKYQITKEIMNKISSLESPSNFLGLVKKLPTLNYGNRLLILDNIQDPGNLGTLIRSAVAFNLDTLILSNDCVDLYNDKTIRSSEGMLFKLNILRKDLNTFLTELKNNNYTIYGTDVINGSIVGEIKFPKKYAIIIGNEGKGLKSTLKNLVDQNIYIPMSPNAESLNAGIAASIIMYEMSKNDYE